MESVPNIFEFLRILESFYKIENKFWIFFLLLFFFTQYLEDSKKVDQRSSK